MIELFADVESNGFLPEMTKLWCLCIKQRGGTKVDKYADQPGYRPISEGVKRLEEADRVIGHNFLGFDIHAIAKAAGVKLKRRRVYDTMAASRLADPELQGKHSLGAWGERFGFPKGDWSDFSKFDDKMVDYCARDVELTEKIYEWCLKKLQGWGESPELEFEVAYIIGLQMQNGFGLDVPRAVSLLGDLLEQKQKVEAELQKQFPPITHKRVSEKTGKPLKDKIEVFNPGSGQQIAARLTAKYGWKPVVFTDGGSPKIDETVLKSLSYPEVPTICEYLRLDKLIGQLNAPIKKDGSGGGWLKHERNGRVHGYVNSNGAVTGRMTHSKPNTANVDKDERMRSLWIPRVGWVLMGCDAEGLELRMLGHYLARWDGGAYARAVVEGKKEDGTDPHSITKKIVGLFSRDFAKTFIYAMIYGAGDTKLGLTIVEDAQKAGKYTPEGAPHLFTTTKTGKVVPRSRSDLGKEARSRIESGIVGLGKLKAAVQFKGKAQGWITGLDGRRIYIRSMHSALNTLLQGAGAIVMKKALVLFHTKHEDIYGRDFAYCANVHDEVQSEVRTPELAKMLGQSFADCIKQAGIELNVRCPLSGSFDIGSNWAETH
jgi:DNA polymerase-1